MRKFILLLCGFSFILLSCNKDDEPDMPVDDFDRSAMLVNWADNIIVPSYEAYVGELSLLVEAKDEFLSETTAGNLDNLRDQWLDAYIAWQYVSLFEIGKAEELSLRDYTNIFPTDGLQIEENISSGSYNLELPSTRDEQGFPALDYLFYGSADSDAEILARFQQETGLRTYMNQLVDRINQLGFQVRNDWQNGYRDVFVENSGSDASSSVNKMLNDYMFYYEKALRAGKIGIPAGVFSVTPLADKVEAVYKRDVSKVLFQIALNTVIDFFNGVHFNGSGQGESIKSYLDYLNTITEGESLSKLINDQFDKAVMTGNQLNDNFYQEVQTNNQAMLRTYDELQKNVVLMKVDMFQALNVKVDYVDADGD